MKKGSSLEDQDWSDASSEPFMEDGARRKSPSAFTPLIYCLVVASIVITHVLVGGSRLLFSIPGYVFVGVAAVTAGVISFRRSYVGPRAVPLVCGVAFAGYISIRSYFSPVEYLARNDRYMAMGALLVYLLTAFHITKPKQRIGMVIALLFLAAVDFGTGLIQFVRNDNFMLLSSVPDGFGIPQIFRPDYGARSSGFLGCPNHLAGFLETLGIVALALTSLGRFKIVSRLLMGSGALICFVGVAFTGSRGGYLSTITGISAFLILVIWIVRKLRPKKFLLIVMTATISLSAMIVGAIVLMSNNAILGNRIASVIDTENMRQELWTAAHRQFQVSPLNGTGSGTYLYFGRQFRSPSVQGDPIHAHNDYLELLCEYGIVGVVLGGVFILAHLSTAWWTLARVVRKRLRPAKRILSNELALALGVSAAFVALLAHSIVDFNTHVPANSLYFAFLLGILASPSCDPQVIRRSSPELMKAARIALPTMGGAVIVLAAPLLVGEYNAEWARVQLRCREYAESAARVYQRVSRGLPTVNTQVIWPDETSDRAWPISFAVDQLLPTSLSFVESGIAQESKNPDLFYYLGEIRHFQALYETDEIERRKLMAAAAEAYHRGCEIFPMDVRLLLRLAQTLDNLGLFEEADQYLTKAFAADPNVSHVYAAYGYHLWRQRKLNRAEAYYRHSLALYEGNELAQSGVANVAHLRSLAANAEYVELYGDPLEGFDLDPPGDGDAARGLKLDD